MGLCQSGLQTKLADVSITLHVSAKESIIKLANLIDWRHIFSLAEADLKNTDKGFWWLGRKLNLRTHLAVMILQVLLKATDRGIEMMVRRCPIYQVFCGGSVVTKWTCPDHTKIETFRNRLTAETHKNIGDYVVKLAVQAGFADPRSVDIDSTVQEANIAYPSDASLMRKLAQKCAKVIDFMRAAKKKYLPSNVKIDLKAVQKKAKDYFFLSRNTKMEKRRQIFKDYHALVKIELASSLDFFMKLSAKATTQLPWNIKQALNQITTYAHQYLRDVSHFIKTHSIKSGKILSFHCSQVSCIKKGKVGKDKEFGRVYQLGRIGGNFMVAYASTSVRMEDKKNLLPSLKEHEQIFGKGVLKDVTADKGYYSAQNIRGTEVLGISALGIQRPCKIKDKPTAENVVHLYNRRAGVEPLIGHVKEFGLRRSKMKSDQATLSQGYRSVMGFNLHQMTRNLEKAA